MGMGGRHRQKRKPVELMVSERCFCPGGKVCVPSRSLLRPSYPSPSQMGLLARGVWSRIGPGQIIQEIFVFGFGLGKGGIEPQSRQGAPVASFFSHGMPPLIDIAEFLSGQRQGGSPPPPHWRYVSARSIPPPREVGPMAKMAWSGPWATFEGGPRWQVWAAKRR